MIFLLSARSLFLDRVSELLQRAPEPVLSRSFRSPLACGAYAEDARWIALDLASSTLHREYPSFVGEWRRQHPYTTFVYCLPCVHYDEGPVGMLCMARAPGVVMGQQDWCRPEAWYELLGRGPVVRFGSMLAEDMVLAMAAREANGYPLPETRRRQILDVLKAAAEYRHTQDLPAELRRDHDCIKGLFFGSRLLWYAKLRDEGFAPWFIAQVLGYQDSTQAGSAIREVWDVGLRELYHVPYRILVEHYAEWLTKPGIFGRVRFRDLRAGIRSLVRP